MLALVQPTLTPSAALYHVCRRPPPNHSAPRRQAARCDTGRSVAGVIPRAARNPDRARRPDLSPAHHPRRQADFAEVVAHSHRITARSFSGDPMSIPVAARPKTGQRVAGNVPLGGVYFRGRTIRNASPPSAARMNVDGSGIAESWIVSTSATSRPGPE